MKTIHKYTLAISDFTIVEVPVNAHLLCVQLQHGEPQLWARVDTDEVKENITIHLVGTGQWLPEEINKMQYLGTLQLRGGHLVLHAFADR